MMCEYCTNWAGSHREVCEDCERREDNGEKIVGGAVVGGLLGGPVGAIAGGILGGLLGDKRRR